MEEDSNLEKRKNHVIVVLVIIIVVLLGALFFLLFIKKDKPVDSLKLQDNQQVENINGGMHNSGVLSDDEVLKIAKDKLQKANHFLNYDSVNTNKCLEKDDLYVAYCFYKTKESLKKDFYSIFADSLTIDDIINIFGSNNTSVMTSYMEKDGDIYLNYMCNAEGIEMHYDNFVVDSKDDKTIIVKYKVFKDYDEFSFEREDDENILKKQYQEYLNNIQWSYLKLINENSEWKISQGVLLDVCGHPFNLN